jgi:hypothetical protein
VDGLNTPLKAGPTHTKPQNKTFESFYKVKIFPINARAFYLLISSAYQNFQDKCNIKEIPAPWNKSEAVFAGNDKRGRITKP